MLSIGNMKIGVRIGLAFGLVVAAMASVSVLGLVNTSRGVESMSAMSNDNHSAVALSNAQSAVWALRWGMAQFIAVSDPAERAKIVSASAESMEEQAGNLAQAVAVFKLAQQPGRPVAARPAASRPAGLSSPRKPATVVQHPSAKAKEAKTSGGGDEWTEF